MLQTLKSTLTNIFRPKLFGFKNEMDLYEAKLILGLSKVNKKDISINYDKYIVVMHPDNHGSPYLCSKLNEAKELLMKSI